MVVLNKIYTKTGDKGETALGDGSRVVKHSPRVSAYGTVDETNATVGLARLHAEGEMDAALARIQNDLFDLGADLCVPDTGKPLDYEPLRIVSAQTTRLEAEIDELNAALEPLRSFVLPGGHPAAAHLHLSRTVSRRAERLMVALSREPGQTVSEPALTFINRLSDFFFVASRWVNARGPGDVLWVKGANR
jgi:cob(I)alamin adenosyltransferase